MIDLNALSARLDWTSGQIAGRPLVTRRLSDLRGCFADTAAYDAALAREDALLYTVSSVEPADGEGDLHYGLGVLMPGRIGSEYYLTKGHLHAWRPAAEVYVGLRGQGAMILETEGTGETRLVELAAGTAVYVPGHVAHRTVNTGDEPLVYVGVYPARAGHDYAPIARTNFRHVVVAGANGPELIARDAFQSTPRSLS